MAKKTLTYNWAVTYTSYDGKREQIERRTKADADRLANSMRHKDSILHAKNIRVVKRKSIVTYGK